MKRPPSSLVLITIDCLRADHVGFLGYRRPTTPFLDILAKESVAFENAITGGTPTYYSLPAMLASRSPLAFGRDILGVAPGEITLASVLKDAGWATAAFVAANPYLCARFGYDQAFDVFLDFLADGQAESSFASSHSSARRHLNQTVEKACRAVPGLGIAYDELYFRYCQTLGAPNEKSTLDSLRRFPSADVIVDHAIAWLAQNSRGPFFLWLHLMDPHAPYYPKPQALAEMGDRGITTDEARYLNSYWTRGDLPARRLQHKKDRVIALYDAGIHWADAQIRRLTEKLVELNVWDKCALAVTADHGEEFLDHGGRFHPPVKLTEELIRVPLLIHAGDKPARVKQPFGMIDLAPTLVDLADISSPASFRGRSRWSKIQSGQEWQEVAITEAVRGCTNPFQRGSRTGARLLSVRNAHFKLVLDFSSGADFLFDLTSDSHEQTPLSATDGGSIRSELLQYARKHLAESQKSRDFDLRLDSQLRDLRIEWAHSAVKYSN